jgi:hypothetical protein
MIGHFLVSEYPHGAAHPTDIAFQLSEDATMSVPKDQSTLKSEAEKTLHVLRALFAPEDIKFKSYYDELLGLCRYGLVGKTAQPTQAMNTLKNLQTQIFDNEKGKVISAYMSTIVKAQFVMLAIMLAAGAAAIYYFVGASYADRLPLLCVFVGLFVGLVFSSFVRCRALTFYDLHAIDADRFSPMLKLTFAGATLLLAAAFLKAEIFEIKVGKAQLSNFDKDYISAFVFGAIVGVAQEAIIARIESIKQKIAPQIGRRSSSAQRPR